MEDFTQIPVIDFEPYLRGSIEDKQRVAEKIDFASQNVGFFYLRNHGISQEIIDRTLVAAKAFFSMKMEDKMKLEKKAPYFVTGYTPPFTERVSPWADYKETFCFVHELPPEDDYLKRDGAEVYSGNQWPDQISDFQQLFHDQFLKAVMKLSDQVMECFATSLQLPTDWFKSISQKAACVGQIAYYPKRSSDIDESHPNCGEHTDDLALTFLAQQDDVSGLQVKNMRGDWIDAVPIPHTLVVNIGDLLERWSNGRFKATLHRVAMKPSEERYSIATFHMPDFHAEIACCVPNAIPKYRPVIAGYFRRKRESYFRASADEYLNNEQAILQAEN